MEIKLEHLTKIFPPRNRKKGNNVVAVKDITLTFPDGKLVALLGPSGCGKSTMLYMICGLLNPTEGKIFFGEDDVTLVPPEDRGVGLVFQNYALYPHLTVLQNILFPLQNAKGKDRLTKAEMLEKAQAVAKIVEIDGLFDRKPKNLSGGQQQRVAIARALVKSPRVLLLDEPLSNLDARLRLQTREEIRKIQKETGVTTVFVTHDQDEAMSISDIIVVMKNGEFQQSGKPQEVYDNPKNLFVATFLGIPAINVFNGKISNGKLYIGDDLISDCAGIADNDVYVGIRPEGLLPDNNGALRCRSERTEVTGRDKTIVAYNPASTNNGLLRSIVDSGTSFNENGNEIRFRVKRDKLFLFGRENEERIYI